MEVRYWLINENEFSIDYMVMMIEVMFINFINYVYLNLVG